MPRNAKPKMFIRNYCFNTRSLSYELPNTYQCELFAENESGWYILKKVLLCFRTYTPSGSGANKKKWVHFDILFFLAEKNRPRKTNSNIGAMSQNSPTACSPGPSSYGSISASERVATEETPLSKRRKKSGEF